MGQRHANRLQALAESTQLFAEASTDLSNLLNVVAVRFSELVGEAVNIRLIDRDALVPVATYHPDPAIRTLLAELHDATPLGLNQGISGHVLATGEPFYAPSLDLATLEARIAPSFFPFFEKAGVSGMIVARLRSRGINLGYLSLFRIGASHEPYTEEDLHLVKDLADRAALAIDNSLLVDSLERRVAERTEALQAANRELEAFAYSVSHDLRSPLRIIDGFSNVLEEDHGAGLGEEGRSLLAAVRRNAQHMSHLIEDLLRLSRLGHRALQPISDIDMRDMVRGVAADIQRARPAITVDLRVGELPRARGNIELLRLVWTNLLDNAVKYSRERPVAIVEVGGLRGSGEVSYTVTDRGAGFDPVHSHKLFGVFQRLHLDAEFEGTGVGLALVQRIVHRHGGRVWAKGRVAHGATFGFGLPERGPREG